MLRMELGFQVDVGKTINLRCQVLFIEQKVFKFRIVTLGSVVLVRATTLSQR